MTKLLVFIAIIAAASVRGTEGINRTYLLVPFPVLNNWIERYDGEQFLGFYADSKCEGVYVKEGQVNVDTTRYGLERAWTVSSNEEDELLFLVRGPTIDTSKMVTSYPKPQALSRICELGRIPGLFDLRRAIHPGTSKGFLLEGKWHRLSAHARRTVEDEDDPYNDRHEGYRLVLESDLGRQEIIPAEGYRKHPIYSEGWMPKLIWAGDMNGDAKLDCLLRMDIYPDAPATADYSLFLSVDRPNTLVEKAATFETVSL
jgi:hypothetical protein